MNILADPMSDRGVNQSAFCMARRNTMITMGYPDFVWINANEIISSWYLLGAACVPPPAQVVCEGLRLVSEIEISMKEPWYYQAHAVPAAESRAADRAEKALDQVDEGHAVVSPRPAPQSIENPCGWQWNSRRMGRRSPVMLALVDRPWASRRFASGPTSRPGLDEGLLSFCLPILILYGDSLLEEQILVTNESAPSYIHTGLHRQRGRAKDPGRVPD